MDLSNTYKIQDNYMDSLMAKLSPIKNKCKKYGFDFECKIIDSYYEYELTENHYYTEKEIKASGRTIENLPKRLINVVYVNANIKFNEWCFIGTIDHTQNGNVINNISGLEIPKRYRETKETLCEHCHTRRFRKQTCIVYNENTQEFKQVGKNCLKVYTGIDAGVVASVVEASQYLTYTQAECFDGERCCGRDFNYYSKQEILAYSYETIRCFGYNKKQTREIVSDFYNYMNCKLHGKQKEKVKKVIEENNVDFTREDVKENVKNALEWLKVQVSNNDYIYNLQTILLNNDTCFDAKYFGYVVSLMQAYKNATEKTAEKTAERIKNNEIQETHFIGNVNDKLDLQVKECSVVSSYNTDYGKTYIYKIIDVNNNILIWRTTKNLQEHFTNIRGTVKAHKEWNGIKQTELTRCKVS